VWRPCVMVIRRGRRPTRRKLIPSFHNLANTTCRHVNSR
jgi:hypothetical protein